MTDREVHLHYREGVPNIPTGLVYILWYQVHNTKYCCWNYNSFSYNQYRQVLVSWTSGNVDVLTSNDNVHVLTSSDKVSTLDISTCKYMYITLDFI